MNIEPATPREIRRREWLIDRSCRKKKYFATRKAAKQLKARAKWLRVYKCSWCDGWHLTRQKGNRKDDR